MEEETSLRELLELLLAGKWVIIASTLITLLLTGVVTFWLVEPTYEAKTVLAINEIKFPEGYQDTGRLEFLIDNYAGAPQTGIQHYLSLAKSEEILTGVAERLQLDLQEIPLHVLAEQIKIFNLIDTDLIEITVRDYSPQQATKIAQAFALEFADYVLAENKENSQKVLTLLAEQRETARADFLSCVEAMQEFLKGSNRDNVVTREDLQFKLDIAKENYAFFQKKHTEVLAAETMGLEKFSVTTASPAKQPTVAIAPKKALNLVIGACLGLLLGVFAVLFKNYWVSQ